MSGKVYIIRLVMVSVVVGFVAVPFLGPTLAARDDNPRVIDSILGVRIGSNLGQVHKKLKKLGTVGGRETQAGGRKEAWTLNKTEFASIAYQTDDEGRVIWVTGFVRPGKEIPFSKLGDLERATSKNDSQVIWTVKTDEGGYRLVAKGPNGKARVVYLFSLNATED